MLRTSRRAHVAKPSAAGVALVLCLLALTAVARDAPRTCSAESAPGELAEEARHALARMPPDERLAEVGDERVRRAVLAARRAVAEIADSREPGRAAALAAKFERAYAAVLRAAARSAHKTCARNCESDGDACRSAHRAAGRKPCGCSLASFACFVAECVP